MLHCPSNCIINSKITLALLERFYSENVFLLVKNVFLCSKVVVKTILILYQLTQFCNKAYQAIVPSLEKEDTKESSVICTFRLPSYIDGLKHITITISTNDLYRVNSNFPIYHYECMDIIKKQLLRNKCCATKTNFFCKLYYLQELSYAAKSKIFQAGNNRKSNRPY